MSVRVLAVLNLLLLGCGRNETSQKQNPLGDGWTLTVRTGVTKGLFDRPYCEASIKGPDAAVEETVSGFDKIGWCSFGNPHRLVKSRSTTVFADHSALIAPGKQGGWVAWSPLRDPGAHEYLKQLKLDSITGRISKVHWAGDALVVEFDIDLPKPMKLLFRDLHFDGAATLRANAN